MKKVIMILAFSLIASFFSTSAIESDDCQFGDHSRSEPVNLGLGKNAEKGFENQKNTSSGGANRNYLFMITASLLLVLIGISLGKILVINKIISKNKEKLFWNILLLIFFIPSAITGVIILGLRDLTFLIGHGNTFSQIHNVSSLFFMWIIAYHILWHTKYYVRFIKSTK